MMAEDAPMAFLIPISAVLSFTLTSMMFMSPTAAPSKVIRPMMAAMMVMVLRVLPASWAMVSL